ncbi:MAG: T9SS type A sorting domain-containing protein [Flavobacteriales bacterium]|nr:T9SS type A sorting domain-containing protein [Flavobacteriales bacterium]
MKLNASGGLEWQTTLGGSGYDRGYSVQQVSDGGFILAGQTASNDGDVNGSHGPPDAWVVKLNEIGAILWQRAYGGSIAESAQAVRETFEGGFIVAGVAKSHDGDVIGHHAGEEPVGAEDMWVLKLSNVGEIEWQRALGGSSSDNAYAVELTGDGGYILAGYTNSHDGDVSGDHGSWDVWVVKLDGAGSIEWQKALGGYGPEIAKSVKTTSDGGYIVAGYSNSNSGDVTGLHGGDDLWVLKLDSVGALIWQKALGGTSEDRANALWAGADGTTLLAGYTRSLNGDVTGNHGSSDAWVVRLDADDAGVDEPTAQLFELYPNPGTDELCIEEPTMNRPWTVRILDASGRDVLNAVQSQKGELLDTRSLKPGLYLVRVVDRHGNMATSRWVKSQMP